MLYDYAVSRSTEPGGGWRVTRAGRHVASFRSFAEAIAAARAWELADSTA